MRNKLAEKCYQALKSSQYWTPKTKENGRSIASLTCPLCGDKSAWANQIEPYSINCNRSNTCGARTKTRELFDITLDIEKEYKATKDDPHKPAREYLKSRGLTETTMQDLDYRYWKKTRDSVKCGAVMFPIAKDDKGKEILNGRLLNPMPSDGKTHNHGSTTGLYWQHNAQQLDTSKTVFITEGIIDALSLIEAGQQAIAVLASGQDPAKLHGLEKYQLACAFDNDEAGTRATKKYLAHFKNARAIMPPKGQDWNDVLVRNKGKSETYFKENIGLFEHYAELALADHGQHYGQIYYKYHNKAPGLFVFDESTWFSYIKVKGEDTSLAVERLGLFTIEVLSFINLGDEKRKEYLYQLRIKPKGQQPITCIATGKAFVGVRDFNTFLMSHAKVNFEGKVNALTALTTLITRTKVSEVRQVPVCGYDPNTEWYFYDNYAVDPKGKVHTKSKNDNYKLDHRTMVAPAPQSTEKAIKPSKKPTADVKAIYNLIHRAWGNNGATAFSWAIASWFVNQIKEKENFFPFLSLHGDPAAGKSALTAKLQAIQGRDLEGLPLSQLNTKKGLARTMAGFSGMFTALLEDSQRNDKAFDYSILLTAYNKGSLQVQAKFTQSLETTENAFLGALLFVQNSEPFNSKQEKQRVISLHFKTEDLNHETGKAFTELNFLNKGDLARVILEVLQKREEIEATWYDEYRVAAADLEAISEERIRNNHALILAFHRIFCKLFNVENIDIGAHMEETGIAKEQSSAELEINEASTFFEMIYSLDSEQLPKYWHEIVEDVAPRRVEFNTLYFSLQELLRLLNGSGLQAPKATDIQKALRQHPAYLGHGRNHRFPTSNLESHTAQRKAWAFDLKKFKETETPPHVINWERWKGRDSKK